VLRSGSPQQLKPSFVDPPKDLVEVGFGQEEDGVLLAEVVVLLTKSSVVS
jgi:hypothetical protein